MKKYLTLLLITFPSFVFSQGLGFGVKAGFNFANVTKASSINNSSRTGFHAGIFIGPPSKKIISSRTELIFSRQGYDYKTSTNTGNVNLDYIMMPQLMSINITKYFSIQLGGHMSYLVSAKADSAKTTTTGNSSMDKMMDLYNRFDYGYGGGIEIHPVSGLLIGARVNISLGNMYKDIGSSASGGNMSMSSFIPKVNVKNNVFQVFAGWQFGKKEKKEKK
jgi:hypothetical protein